MWCDHQFSQGNKATKEGGGGLDKISIEVAAESILKQNGYRLLGNDCHLLKFRNSIIATSLIDKAHMLFIKAKNKSKANKVEVRCLHCQSQCT